MLGGQCAAETAAGGGLAGDASRQNSFSLRAAAGRARGRSERLLWIADASLP